MTVLTNTISDAQLAYSYHLFLQNDDKKNAEKLIDLYEKKRDGEYVISFTGHFSAGKSSLINYLIGKEMLPNSPIPTSANIVKLTSGAGVVRVHFNDAQAVYYEEPYDIDLIQQYCMNKASIKKMEISTSESIIPKNCAFVDTPGIDAADDTDRLITESSLHTVDALCYVMDYNHVQSEVNLQFLTEMKKQQIPLTILINQIDKHNEKELSFGTFKRHVEETFRQWEIEPEKIFYISVKHEDDPNNELHLFKRYVFDLCTRELSMIDERLQRAFEYIVKDHESVMKERFREKLETFEQLDEKAAMEAEWKTVTEQLATLKEKQIHFNEQYEATVNETLKNAYLMPAQLRDLAANVIEANEKGFKVGFFNAKKKTAEERAKRLDDFYTELQQTIESTIQWTLRNKLTELIESYDIQVGQIHEQIQQLHIVYDKERLLSFLKDGATFNNAYVLNYTNDVSNDIKQQFRKRARTIFDTINDILMSQIREEMSFLERRQRKLRTVLDSFHEKEALEQERETTLAEIERSLHVHEVDSQLTRTVEEIVRKRNDFVKEAVPKELPEKRTDTEVVLDVNHEITPVTETHSYDTIVSQLEQTIAALEESNVLQHMMDELREKQQRLQQRNVTVALFGAFSAGKSSFSNALLGERVLPVSPNPTTAVINRISPITPKYEHGTVMITFKDETTLLEDVRAILKDAFDATKNFSETIAMIKESRLYESETIANMHQAYLRALIAGYDHRKDEFGKTKRIDLTQFSSFVTEEKIACYIETVDLYYDCSLTQKGITLVDTPGADSVNARHTNVSFDYIKEADAIIYVTYYNHAITSADRDFLMQLGRVKESFELDKMFFIVNAADLAKDERELELVTSYVNEQLVSFGIRDATIYPVSSKNALIAKEKNEPVNKQMNQFERRFYEFIEHDLIELTLQGAQWEIERVRHTLKTMLASVQMDQEMKEQRIFALHEMKERMTKTVNSMSSSFVIEQLNDRIQRQLHFVLERLYIRFHDMFIEHFNPTTITASGRQAMKQLETCRTDLLQYVGYELLQEVRAVTLRMEAHGKQLLRSLYEELQEQLVVIDDTLIASSLHDISFESPHYEEAFTQIDIDIFQRTLRMFKNTRSFFEQNERDEMKEHFYHTLRPFAEAYVQAQQKTMVRSYHEQMNEWTNEIKQQIITELTTMIEEQIQLLTNDEQVITLQMIYEKLNEIVNDV